MSAQTEMLEVVDENDNVIGLETRAKVHEKGLLHREIHIWFITPKGEIIFQHRGKNKSNWPDRLDATVGGHVDPGMTYEETVIKEAREETGIDLDLSKLSFIQTIRKNEPDPITGLINNVIRPNYAYVYDGDISNLKVEEGNGGGVGFEIWSLDKLKNLTSEEVDLFVPLVISSKYLEIFDSALLAIKLK